MDTINEKQLTLDKRYIRMAGIWAENSYCTRRKVGALTSKAIATASGFTSSVSLSRIVINPYIPFVNLPSFVVSSLIP